MTEASNHSIKEDDLITISSVPIEHSQNLIKFLDQAAKTYNIHKIYKIVEIITYLVLNYKPFREDFNQEKIKIIVLNKLNFLKIEDLKTYSDTYRSGLYTKINYLRKLLKLKQIRFNLK